MFLLPNGSTIDIEGVCDALEDFYKTTVYFLDSLTGEVGEVERRAHKKLARLEQDTRYFRIPVVAPTAQVKWLREFIKEMLDEKSELGAALTAEIETQEAAVALKMCEILLEKDEEGWIHGWVQWRGDELYTEAEEWFSTLSIKIIDKWEGDDDCPLCRMMSEDEDMEDSDVQ